MIIDDKFPNFEIVKIVDLYGNTLGPFCLYDTENKYGIMVLADGEKKGLMLPHTKALIDGKEVR